MTTDEKATLITAIMQTLGATAKLQKKAFDEGDTFFALAFKSDAELQCIAKLVLV